MNLRILLFLKGVQMIDCCIMVASLSLRYWGIKKVRRAASVVSTVSIAICFSLVVILWGK